MIYWNKLIINFILERLQKYMASLGIASRRKCEEFIANWMVKVNWKIVTEMWVKVDPESDSVEFDNERLDQEDAKLVYYALNKPVWSVCSAKRTKFDKNIVTDLVPNDVRVFPIWRLDKDSTGLIILTNDWRLTFSLTHPSQEHEKEYLVSLSRNIEDKDLEELRTWVMILWKRTNPVDIERVNNYSFKIVLKEGRNRQIRRMCLNVWYTVISLHRFRIGKFILQNIKIGKFVKLNATEVELLHEKWIRN